MKVVLITTTTPASDNIRGTSALQYHLMIERDPSIDIIIYTYNFNKLSEEKIRTIEDELHVTINLLPKPKWFAWVLRFHLLILRIFLKFPLLSYVKLSTPKIKEIRALDPDGIWVYGEEISKIMMQFPEYKRIHLGPDSEALYYYRMLKQRFVIKSRLMFWRQAIMYPKYLALERQYSGDKNATYFVVGKEDCNFIKNINPECNVQFLVHPHYNLYQQKLVQIKFNNPIRLLIAGQNNLYMEQDSNEIFNELICSRSDIDKLKKEFVITFLGKGWENHVIALRNAGWIVEHIKFAPDYKEEVCKHDIQISPISVGTGTKGKVLDAMANGLLMIGSKYAMENISIVDGESAVVYQRPTDILKVLFDVLHNKEKYEGMAKKGMECVLEAHKRSVASKKLFASF